MYTWIWRRLPGGLPGKLLGTLVLLFGVLVLLFYVVFPAVEPHLPWNRSTVSGTISTPASQVPSPSPT